MPRVTNTKKPIEKKSTKPVVKKSNKTNKIILFSVLGVLLVGLGALTYWIIDTYVLKESEPNYERFVDVESIVPITLDNYKWLVGASEEDALKDVEHNVYVYIYNGNFKECTVCESLESAVIEAANAAAAQGYSFYVIDYNDKDNEGLVEYIQGLFLPNRPALIHIEGEALASENAISTSPTAILSILNQIKN